MPCGWCHILEEEQSLHLPPESGRCKCYLALFAVSKPYMHNINILLAVWWSSRACRYTNYAKKGQKPVCRRCVYFRNSIVQRVAAPGQAVNLTDRWQKCGGQWAHAKLQCNATCASTQSGVMTCATLHVNSLAIHLQVNPLRVILVLA